MKILPLIPLSLVFMISCSAPEEEENPQPNIIYVLADDLGYGDLSCYNEQGEIPTPYLDQLTQNGVRFTDAHSSSAVCTPTRYSTLTGRYNWRTRLKSGVLTGKSKALIPNDRTTVASLLKQHGYRTGFVGKWHLGWDWGLTTDTLGGTGWQAVDFDNMDFSKPIKNNPNDLGFDYAYGHSGSLDMAPYVYVENGKVTAIPDTVTVDTGKYTWWRKGPTAPDFVHEQVTPHFFEKAIEFIENEKDSSFFLYLALPSPHTPILPTEEWLGKSELNPYADFVMMIDDYMGKLKATLVEQGIDQNTIIVFTSDNGCSPQADFEILGEKGHDPSYVFRGHKADIYEGGHRVPYIVHWPAQIKGNRTSDQFVCSTDLMATCAAIVGASLQDNEGEDSYSFLPILQGTDGQTEREDIIHHSINGSFAIRKGDYKLIMSAGSAGWSYPTPKQVQAQDSLPPIQLYNLQDDPAETQNLQATESAQVEALKALLSSYITQGRSTPGTPQKNDPIDGEWKQIGFVEQSIVGEQHQQ